MSVSDIHGDIIDPETIKELLGLIKGMIEILNLNKKSKIQEKSILDKRLEQINTKHRVLTDQIFYPLYKNIVDIEIFETNFPVITFTASQVYDSIYYDDGLEHLKKYVDKFLTRLEDLDKKVKIYNEKRSKFNNDLIKRHVSNYILTKGFEVTYNANTVTPSNTINLSILLPELKSYWFGEKTDILVTRYEDALRIPTGMGPAEIAIYSKEDEVRVKNLINDLKELDEIKKKFREFYEYIKDITEESIKLSKDIGENIIKFIDFNEYDNMCEICNPSDVS
jgi:hypothetical protein